MRAEALLAAALWIAAPAPAQDAEADAGYRYQEEERVRSSLVQVLDRPEFERLRVRPDEDGGEASWLDRILDWIEEWLERDRVPGEDGPPSSFARTSIQLAAAVVILVATLFLLRAAVARTSEGRTERPSAEGSRAETDPAPGERAPQSYLDRAEHLHQSGQHREAIGTVLLALMSGLERSGRIRHRPGLTARDYVRAGKGNERREIRVVTGTFERVFFGRRDATEGAYRSCHEAASRVLQDLRGALDEEREVRS